MRLGTILCIFSGADDEVSAVGAALLLGKRYDAHIRFLHISPDPIPYIGFYGDGMITDASLIDAIERGNVEQTKKAKQHVARLTAKYHVPFDGPELVGPHASAEFVHVVGFLDNTITKEGRASDLIVIGRGKRWSHDFLTPALFATGRPVLLMLTAEISAMEWTNKTIAIAWKETKEAMQAIYHAMPFLETAQKVYLLTAEGHGETYDLDAASALLRYLDSHRIQAQGVVVMVGEHSVAEALHARAKELNADMIVMGAYGHSVFREMILGGATEYMLRHVEIPLLLAH